MKISAPPRGRLFQETLRRRPFWMLVACCLVNCTTWEKARHAHAYLMRCYTIKRLAAMAECDDRVYCAIEHLGFGSQRTMKIIAMARAWLAKRPTRAEEVYDLPGCGKYASDSWSIFVDGNLDVSPQDGKLNWYLQEIRDAIRSKRGRPGRPRGRGRPHGDKRPGGPGRKTTARRDPR